jgi:hypothetical protein
VTEQVVAPPSKVSIDILKFDPICQRPIAIADMILTEAKRKEVLALLAALDDDELRFVKAEGGPAR